MNWDKLEIKLERIEHKLDELQPLVDEYKAHKILMKKAKDYGKILGMLFGIVLGGMSIKEKFRANDGQRSEEKYGTKN